MTDRPALLDADLARVPEVLRRHAAATRPALAGATKRVILSGLGSSRFPALAIVPALREGGLEVIVEHASTARPAPLGGPGTLLVAISSSGRTPETVAAAKRARAAGAAVLAITNDPGSALAAAADTVIALHGEDEASGVASLTYAATVAALVRLAEGLGSTISASELLAAAAAAADEVLAARGSWLVPATDVLDGGGRAIHVVADAAALGTAEQSALLFREGPRLEADATDAGDWLHVGLYTALPGYRALLLSGTPYDVAIAEVIRDRGGHLLAVGPAVVGAAMSIALPPAATADPLARALVEPLVTASLAAELWRRTSAPDA